MKNKILIIWLISISILFSPVITHGDSSSWQCDIETQAAESLTNYIKNIRKAVTNTNKSLLWKSSQKNTGQSSVAWNNLSRIYNETINWDWFYTDFSYYLTFPMLNDIPTPIQRDLTLLESETEWLRKYLKTLVNKWYSWVSLTSQEVCEWVKNCSLQWNPINIIWEIIKNHTQITTLYKQIVTSPKEEHNLNTILTYDSNSEFIWELIKNYWNDTIEWCSNTEDWFSTRIKEAKEAILLNNKQWKDWIKKWRDAWKLLVWSWNTWDYQKKERELLQKELSRQWLSVNAQEIMLNNLEEFNKNWFYSLDNNFIQNSYEQLKGAWWKIVDWFNEATKDLLGSEDTKKINQEASIWINTLLSSTDKVNITDSIKKRLAGLYETHIQYASIESYSTVKLQAEIINMHTKIKHSSETLRATCELAVKVCNDQWKWKWNCGSCK